jgi:tetratricopeptide (TPR) repeat protein
LRLASALWRFWARRVSQSEGSRWLERALAATGAAPAALRAKALFALAGLLFDLGDLARAHERYQESLALRRQLGDDLAIAESLTGLGMVTASQGELTQARALHEEALAVRRRLGDAPGIARSLNNLGVVVRDEGDLPRARGLLQESLALWERLENPAAVAYLCWTLGDLARAEGDLASARQLLEQSLALLRTVGDKLGAGAALLELGLTARQHEEVDLATRRYAEALELFVDLAYDPGIVEGVEGLAIVAATRGQFEPAARLLGAATARRRQLDLTFTTPAHRGIHERTVAAIERSAGAVWAPAWSSGYALPLEQAAAEALAISRLD